MPAAAAARYADEAGADAAAPADLWARLRQGFAMPPLPPALTDPHLQRLLRSGQLQASAARIRLYMPLIAEETAARGLPLELALVPVIESALRPEARSPVGAFSTWQFMPATARHHELRISSLVDDRQNLRLATRAALDYLQRLHAQFGDWHLALASYNWGEGRVARLRQRMGGEAGFVEMAAHMPAETRQYVPAILGLARLIAEASAYPGVLPPAPAQHDLVEVALRHDLDFRLALDFSGLTPAQWRALNPATRAPLLLASATPALWMPTAAAERFTQRMADHAGPRSSWRVLQLHTTQPLNSVAAQHGTTVAALREVNDIPRGSKPTAGSSLLVPAQGVAVEPTSAQRVADATLTLVPDTVAVRVAVQTRERVADVAGRLGVPAADLARWNQLPGPRARVGRNGSLTAWVLRDDATRAQAAITRGPQPPKHPSKPSRPKKQ